MSIVQAVMLAQTAYEGAKVVKEALDHIKDRDNGQEIDHGQVFDSQLPPDAMRAPPGLKPEERDRMMTLINMLGGQAPAPAVDGPTFETPKGPAM